jgi:hypothetical protein
MLNQPRCDIDIEKSRCDKKVDWEIEEPEIGCKNQENEQHTRHRGLLSAGCSGDSSEAETDG